MPVLESSRVTNLLESVDVYGLSTYCDDVYGKNQVLQGKSRLRTDLNHFLHRSNRCQTMCLSWAF